MTRIHVGSHFKMYLLRNFSLAVKEVRISRSRDECDAHLVEDPADLGEL